MQGAEHDHDCPRVGSSVVPTVTHKMGFLGPRWREWARGESEGRENVGGLDGGEGVVWADVWVAG